MGCALPIFEEAGGSVGVFVTFEVHEVVLRVICDLRDGRTNGRQFVAVAIVSDSQFFMFVGDVDAGALRFKACLRLLVFRHDEPRW